MERIILDRLASDARKSMEAFAKAIGSTEQGRKCAAELLRTFDANHAVMRQLVPVEA